MNERQRRFADEYIKTGNIFQSAINAGYSETYAKTDSHKILEKPSVKSYIDKRLDELKKESIAEQDEILQYLTSIVRGEETEETFQGVGKGEQIKTHIEVSAKDRIKAAELLLKRYMTFTSDELKNEKLKAEIDHIKQKTKLIKGVEKDTSLLESLIEVVNEDK